MSEREETRDEYLEREEQHRAAEDAAWLRSLGYIVLAPSDTSPVAELVRAAVEYAKHNHCVNTTDWSTGRANHLSGRDEALKHMGTLAPEIAEAPSVRAWVERGRK